MNWLEAHVASFFPVTFSNVNTMRVTGMGMAEIYLDLIIKRGIHVVLTIYCVIG